MAVGHHLERLGRQSVVYGVGGLLVRGVGVILLPLYTAYLSPADYGKIEVLLAATAVLAVVLRRGISVGLFRFYFDSADPAYRTLVVRTTFWFTMATATIALVCGLVFAEPLASLLQLGGDVDLVRAAAVGLWVQLNYEQLTAVFRAEERPHAFVVASLATLLTTVAATVVLVVVLEEGPIGVLLGTFVGTLAVYLVLLAYRREQLGFQFDRQLLREMNRFGMPLLPAALALWVISFVDRWFVAVIRDQDEVGVYSVAVRMSSAVLFLMLAVRRAWPTIAYSIEDDEEARRTYSFVVTYVVFLASWAALGLSLLAPWLVDVFTSNEGFARAADAVPFLAFGGVAYAAYSVVAVSSARSKRTQGNWIVAGGAAALNVGLNLLLIPPYGMVGAAVATLLAYIVLFAGIVAYGQRVYRVEYQWRRLLSVVGLAGTLAVAGVALELPPAAALPLALAFPLLLAPLGFYLPGEVARLLRFVPALR